MKNKRPLAPRFLNQLDDYLLKNKPDTWSARTHLILYYGLLFAIVLSVICFLAPDDPRNSSNVFTWSFFVALLSAIGFIVWMIFLLRFNVFKRFGTMAKGDKIKTFLLYFTSIGMMVAVIYIPAAIETIRANMAYGNEEIVQDVNNINLAICRLNIGSIPTKWKSDTFLVRNVTNPSNRYRDDAIAAVDSSADYDESDDDQVTGNFHRHHFYIVDTAEFRARKMSTDSIITLNDSMYIFYECPSYEFVRSYGSGFYAGITQLSSADIYKQVFRNPQKIDKAKTLSNLQVLLRKYKASLVLNDDETDNEYRYRIGKKYGLNGVNLSIDNITNRKYRWKGSEPEIFLRLFFYSTLILTLLVFIFRHSTIKTFFLTLLSAIVLLIITSLVFTFFHLHTTSVFVCCIAFFLVFLVTALLVNFARTRNAITGIGLNLAVFFTAFIPLLVVGFCYQLMRDADELKVYDEKDFIKYRNENLHYMLAEIGGAILLLFLIETVFKKLYRKWYALPDA